MGPLAPHRRTDVEVAVDGPYLQAVCAVFHDEGGWATARSTANSAGATWLTPNSPWEKACSWERFSAFSIS